eukprot:scaffold1915_cov288-Prasinococcus_capsulatus_cf.AAC.7
MCVPVTCRRAAAAAAALARRRGQHSGDRRRRALAAAHRVGDGHGRGGARRVRPAHRARRQLLRLMHGAAVVRSAFPRRRAAAAVGREQSRSARAHPSRGGRRRCAHAKQSDGGARRRPSRGAPAVHRVRQCGGASARTRAEQARPELCSAARARRTPKYPSHHPSRLTWPAAAPAPCSFAC